MSNMADEYTGRIPEKIIDDYKKEAENFKITKAQEKEILDRIERDYNNALINPGEAIGIITAQSFGEPSTQMCVHFDEKVIVKTNNSIDIVKIGSFVDSFIDSGIYNVGRAKGYEFCDAEAISVLALNEEEKLEWKNVSKLNRHIAPKKLIKISTKAGRTITATDFHSFVTRQHNKIISIAGKDLKIKDRIPSIKYLPEHCISNISVCEYIDVPSASSHEVNKSYNLTKLIPQELDLDWNFGWFIGAYLAEGCAPAGQVSISNLDNNYISHARKFLNKINLDYVEKYHHRGFAYSRDLITNSSLLAKFMRNVCGTGSNNKKVPVFAYSAKEEFVSGLLQGYFDGDGNFTLNRRMIRVSSNSEELLDGIKLLLTRFSIFASKSKDHKQHYLMIPYKYAPLFLEKIGSSIKPKGTILYKLADLACKNTLENYSDYNDMISGFDNILLDISNKLGLKSRFVNSATKRQKIGRTALLRHILRFESESKKNNIGISTELNILKNMVNSDVVWDEITGITYVENNYKYVYDLTVPGLHTFTTFDGIVTHNTLNTFHFAGVAELNITLGLPRLIELFDARISIETPMMEIYLKKEYRNDEAAVKKIASLIKETKFNDIISDLSINVMKMQIEASLNKEELKNLKINSKIIVENLTKKLKNCLVKEADNTVTIKPSAKESELKELYKLKEKVKDVYMSGISGIDHVLPVKRTNEYLILTVGNNLNDVLEIKEVDETRTISNDIIEVQKVLGVEAARNAIINEALRVLKDQGLDIDIRHIMLIADLMTVTGRIRGITRSGITGEKESVLARASFETPIKHLINASLIGEIDNLNSVVENVMLNQPVPIGTGLPGLLARMKKDK